MFQPVFPLVLQFQLIGACFTVFSGLFSMLYQRDFVNLEVISLKTRKKTHCEAYSNLITLLTVLLESLDPAPTTKD